MLKIHKDDNYIELLEFPKSRKKLRELNSILAEYDYHISRYDKDWLIEDCKYNFLYPYTKGYGILPIE